MAWDNVTTDKFDILERQAVAGGWLYRNRTVTGGQAQFEGSYVWQVALTFVPDVVAPPPAEEAPPEGETLPAYPAPEEPAPS
jgi:hypothetical protein